MTVWELGRKMPITEFHLWIQFYAMRAEKNRQETKSGGGVNLLDLDPEQLAKAFGDG
jgi:hypothetical protein